MYPECGRAEHYIVECKTATSIKVTHEQELRFRNLVQLLQRFRFLDQSRRLSLQDSNQIHLYVSRSRSAQERGRVVLPRAGWAMLQRFKVTEG